MDWIKKHYDQFALGLVALTLVVFAILLFLKTQSFGERFTDALAKPVPNENVPPVKLDEVDKAKELLAKPPAWVPDPNKRGSLFAAELYMLDPASGLPKRPGGVALWKDSLTGEPIPNKWFIDNGLPVFDPTVAMQDPDKDQFLNEDEWRHKTDPNNRDSHPPYYTKLFLKQVIRVPFRLRFTAYDGDPKKDKIENFSFQINTIDLRQPSEFLKIGDKVSHTNFKIEKFEYKTAINKGTGEEEDVSELTVVNTETGDKPVLILNRIIDSPDFFILFDYQWPQPPMEFRVKRLGEFRLKPNVKEIYKLIDIKEAMVVIQLPDGQTAADGTKTVEIARDPRKK